MWRGLSLCAAVGSLYLTVLFVTQWQQGDPQAPYSWLRPNAPVPLAGDNDTLTTYLLKIGFLTLLFYAATAYSIYRWREED